MSWSTLQVRARTYARRLADPRLRIGWTILAYLLLVAVVTAVLFWRFPNNVTVPNFYGEDGSVYLQNVLDHGWLKGSLMPFNGYSIVGLYLLCGFGWVINAVFLGGSFLTLPAGFTWSAMVFMAAVICLPFVLFRQVFGRLAMLLVIAFGAVLPLPMSPHVVIGTIGNQKWIFLYLAFLLVLYRVIYHRKLSRPALLAVDAALLISAYTNSTVYLLMPVLFWPYLKELWEQQKRMRPLVYLRRVWPEKEFRQLVVLCALLVPQVAYVVINGIPKLAGYLDTPFDPSRAIELFVNRTYLFGLTHGINYRLNDLAVVMLFGLMLYLAWKKLKGSQSLVFWAGIYSAGMASLLFVLNRPGVTDHFLGYQPSGSGPDQFFYAQTLVMYLPIVLLVLAAVVPIRQRLVRASVVVVFAAVVMATGVASSMNWGEQWRSASVYENDAGTFIDRAIAACDAARGERVRVTVYPYKDGRFTLNAPQDEVCTAELSEYQTSHDNLGLTLNNNNHSPVLKNKQFTQTFVAEQGGLEGVKLFISTFGVNQRKGVYKLQLLDEGCKRIIRAADIPTNLMDNSFYNARFTPVEESGERTYCFTLQPPAGAFDPIAVQHSKPGVYSGGVYREREEPRETDVVFSLLFDPDKDRP